MPYTDPSGSYPQSPAGPPQSPSWLPPAPVQRSSRGMPARVGVLIGLGIVLMLCLLAGILFAPADEAVSPRVRSEIGPSAAVTGAGSAATAPGERAAAVGGDGRYGVGEVVRGGDLSFTVHAVKCGIAKVESRYGSQARPQGSFCRVDVTAANDSGDPQFFWAEEAVAVKDSRGRTFSPHSEAGVYGNALSGSALFEEINPGNSVRGYVYFDMPKDAKAVAVVFDAGLFSFDEDAEVRIG